jgi:HYR domain-containing protein
MNKLALLFLAVLCLPTAALADQISSVAPPSFFVFAVEEFITVSGTGLTGTDSTVVEISGEAGDFTVVPTFADATSLYVSVPDVVFSAAGTYTVTVLATDTGGAVRQIGSGTFDVIERPAGNDPPLIALPEVVVAEATSPAGAVVTFDAFGVSSDGVILGAACDHASGTLFPLGTTTVHCMVSSSSGSAEGDLLVVVTDTTRPVVTVPAGIVSPTPVVTFTATATDNIDGALPVVCDPASGSTFDPGETIVDCRATDAHANVGTASFTVVIGPPTLDLPADFTVEATGPGGAVVTYTVSTSPGATVACVPPSGATFPLGTTTVQCTATDTFNQTTTGAFSVTVADTTPPAVTSIVATPSNLWPPNHKMVAVSVAVTAQDAVDAAPVSKIVTVTSNQPINGSGDGNTAPDWEITGPLTLNLRAERADGADRLYTIEVVTTDFSGNSTTSTVVVSVAH